MFSFKRFLKEKKTTILLITVLVFGLLVRSKDFNVLPIDAHPMRQTDTECVAYFLATGKSNFLNPKSCLIRPVFNSEGYFFLEMPFYEGLIALSYKIFGFQPFAARLVNLALYLLGSIALFVLMSEWWSKRMGFLSVLIYSFIPGSIFFVGHAFHPDALAVSFILISLFFAWKYREKGKFLFLLFSGLFLGISVASRPFGLICLPLLFYFLYLRKSKWWNYLLLLFLSLGLYIYWRYRIFSLGIDVDWENWVLAGREKLFDLGLLKNFLLKNVFGETMGKVVSILAGFGLLLGLIRKEKRMIPLVFWILGVIVYWLLVPNGNLTHQYYADVYIPLVVILAAIGLDFIFSKSKIIFVIILSLVIYNGVRTSNYHYQTNIESDIDIKVAEEIKKEIGEDEKIIYLVRSDSIPLSLSHRQGWILGEWPIDVSDQIWAFMEMRHAGFDFIVEAKHKTDLKSEDWDIIKMNFPLVKDLEYIRIYKYR